MKSAVLLLSLAVLLAAPPLLAQCQNYTGLTYATYQDAAGQTQELKLELLVPTAAAPVPVVVWIHGGGWFNGSRLPIPTYVSALCSKGYAVASIDYRLTTTALWPAQIQDSKGAVRWLRAHAATYNLDPDRFAAWGGSAGAHLASMLGTSGDERTVTIGNFTADLEGATVGNTGFSSRVQAVVSWYGYGDMLQMNFYPSTQNHDTNRSPESKLVGDFIQKVPERTATASPITFASLDDPPFLVMHGTLDDLVPFNQSELLVDALRRNGVRVTWLPVPDAGHGNPAFNTTATFQAVYDFLQATLLDLPAMTVRVVAVDASASETGPGTATFTVSRTGSTASPLTVRWAPGGTARIGTDYTLATPWLPWSVVLPAGAASASLTLTPVNDLLVEGEETAVIKLVSHPAYRIDDTGGSATAVLSDNDMTSGLPEVTIEATDPAASEEGPAGGSFTVSVSPSPASDLLVRYEVSGTATNGEDIAALSGELTVPAGISSVDLDVEVLSDSRLEPSETVILTLSPSRFYELGSPSVASVHILELDDNSLTPVVSISAADPYLSEPGADKGSFAITRTGSTASSLLIDLVVGGSAEEGSDFWGLSSSVMFGKDVSRIVVMAEARDDGLAEGPETVTLAVPPGASFLLGPYTGSTLTIADDEPSQGADGFYPLTPCRLVDTRGPAGPWGKPRLEAGEVRVFELGGRCGIPPDAIALSLNVTVTSPDSAGFVTLFETGPPRPNAFTTTFAAGQTRANNTIAKLTGVPPSLAVYCGAATGGLDLILDVTGYFR